MNTLVRPFEREIVLPRLAQLNKSFGPVTALLLAELNGWSERSTREWLRRLENNQMVLRPHGPRSGFVVNREVMR